MFNYYLTFPALNLSVYVQLSMIGSTYSNH